MFIPVLARTATALCVAASLAACAGVGTPAASDTHAVTFQQIRNATIKVAYGKTTFLIDPMLAPAGTYAATPGSVNDHLRNPLVELPMSVADVMKADAVIVTHLHFDHWDEAASKQLPRNMPIFAQNEQDAAQIRSAGFQDVRVLGPGTRFNGITLDRTGGQHGSDATMAVRGRQLGTVSGIVFRQPGYKTVYVAGDTVWNRHVDDAIATYRPDVVVLNTGYVRFQDTDGAIIMGKQDLQRASQAAPGTRIIASHMGALSHSTQSRQELADFIAARGLDAKRVTIPADGERYRF